MRENVTSTKATVHDPQKVREILADYEVDGVEILLHEEDGSWILEVVCDDPDPLVWGWPTALHIDDWPDEDRYSDEEEEDEDGPRETEWGTRFAEKGYEGFLALLRDLIPYLETSLLILAVEYFDFPGAEVWSIHPGAKEVETLHLSR
jgi:hypothetical protein